MVMVVALLVALVVAVSGIVGAITDTHDPSPISRPVFFNIPGALEATFYTLTTMLFAVAGWLFFVRVQNWERGQPDRRATTPKTIKRRLEDLRSGLYMQTLLRDPAAGVMHSLIYFPFLVLFAVTTVSSRSTISSPTAPNSSTAGCTRATSSSVTPPACSS